MVDITRCPQRGTEPILVGFFFFLPSFLVWGEYGEHWASFVGCINKKTLEFVRAGIPPLPLMRGGTLSASKCPDNMVKLNTYKYARGDSVVRPIQTVVYSVASGLLPVF